MDINVKLKFCDETEPGVFVYIVDGTDKFVVLTEQQATKAQLLPTESHLLLKQVKAMLEADSSETQAPRRAPAAPVAAPLPGPTQGPERPPGPTQGPPQAPQGAPPSAPPSPEIGAVTSQMLAEFGLDQERVDKSNLPYRINDDATNSQLTLEDVKKLVNIYEGVEDVNVKIEIIRKIEGLPPRLRIPMKGDIPKEIREAVVRNVIGRDGLNSGFVPAEEAMFLGDEPFDIGRSFGFRPKGKRGEVPEDFEGSGVQATLDNRMTPRYKSIGSDASTAQRLTGKKQ
tara:strand:+ start:901 stop:1755 length:855 start_codon:yes stop_codon:yes gene_type:complete